MLPTAVIVQARFGDIVQDARMKVLSAIGALESKVLPFPIRVLSASLEGYAVDGVGNVSLGMDAAIGCEVLDGTTACWCPERGLVEALQHHT